MKTLNRVLCFLFVGIFFVFANIGCGVQMTSSEIDDTGIQYYLNEDQQSYSVSFEHVTESTVIVPDEYKGKPVTTVVFSLFSSSAEGVTAPITNLTLPSSVTTLTDYAFLSWYHLETIVLSENITYIGRGAFENCFELKEITIPEQVTEILPFTFSYCSKLESVTFLGSITSIGEYAFSRCEMLQEFTLPEGLLTIDKGAFFMCTSLETISFPSTLTSIGSYAFSQCDNLQTVILPLGIAEIGHFVFSPSPSLTTFTIPLENLYFTYEDGVLYNKDMTILISVYQPSDDTTFIIPSTVVSIEDYAFIGYDHLEEVVFSASLEEIGRNVFYMCNSLQSIQVDADNQAYSSEDGVLYNKEKTILILYPEAKPEISFTIPASVLELASYSFVSVNNLVDLTIPDTVEIISENAFQHCPNLVIHQSGE